MYAVLGGVRLLSHLASSIQPSRRATVPPPHQSYRSQQFDLVLRHFGLRNILRIKR